VPNATDMNTYPVTRVSNVTYIITGYIFKLLFNAQVQPLARTTHSFIELIHFEVLVFDTCLHEHSVMYQLSGAPS
jgi:hypothetical protein